MTMNKDELSVQRFTSPFLLTKDTFEQNALIILNTPICTPPSLLFRKLWEKSSVRICADGGANRLYDATVSAGNNLEYIPTAIKGDLDSIRDYVRDYYVSKGAFVEQDSDQDTNDLDKSFQLLERQFNQPNGKGPIRIFVYGAFGGRFDQEMGCVQALYKWGRTFHDNLVLYNDETCAFLVPPNKRHEIRLPNYGERSNAKYSLDNLGEGPTCGLIPLGCSCDSARTTGLKWNLSDCRAEFGGLVSTSNRVMEPVVCVEASHPLVFTAEMVRDVERSRC